MPFFDYTSNKIAFGVAIKHERQNSQYYTILYIHSIYIETRKGIFDEHN